MMPKKCDHCGESAIEDDEQVCRSCGIVTEGITFGSEFTHHPQTKVHHKTKNFTRLKVSTKTKPPIALEHGLSALKNLCHVFNLPTDREKELAEMLKKIYPAKKFKSREDVSTLAGCCLFLVQRRNKQPIPLSRICQQLPCSKKKFGFSLNFLKNWLSITSPNFFQSSTEEEHGIFSNCEKTEEFDDPHLPESAVSFIPSVCEHAPDEEKSKLEKKTAELVKLAYSCWLYTGRSPRSVVVACAFLCWKSMHPSRKKASYTKFCSMMKIHNRVAKLRIREIKELLLQLGQKIPSVTENYVNKENVLFHLDRILENSETLRNDLLGNEFMEKNINLLEFKSFRRPCKESPRRPPRCAVQYDSDINASDVEISDTEIDSYIIENPQEKNLENLSEDLSLSS